MTGFAAFMLFQGDVFQSAGFVPDEINAIFPPGPATVLSMIAIVCVVAGIGLVDSKWGGRKNQLLATSALMAPLAFLAAATEFAGFSPKIILLCVVGYCLGFQTGWGIVPWVYPAELFMMHERERALSIATVCGFGFNVLVVAVSKVLYDWNRGSMWMLFGVFNVANFIFVAALVKETKGVNLGDVPAMFDRAEALGKDVKDAPLV